MKTKFRYSAFVLLMTCLGYFAGNFVANYRWLDSYFLDSMAQGEQNSVKYALVYMKRYMQGDTNGAHKWMQEHALSDPEWMLTDQSPLSDAISLTLEVSSDNMLTRMSALRLMDLEQVKLEQNTVRKFVVADGP